MERQRVFFNSEWPTPLAFVPAIKVQRKCTLHPAMRILVSTLLQYQLRRFCDDNNTRWCYNSVHWRDCHFIVNFPFPGFFVRFVLLFLSGMEIVSTNVRLE